MFEISLFLLILTGFIAIAVSGALDGISVALVSLALLVRASFIARRKQISIPESWDVYFSLGYVAFYVVDYLFVSRAFIAATVHLVLFSMVVKLFSIRRDRDCLYLAVLAFLQVLAGCVLTVDAIFAAVFGVFALLALCTFVAFEIRRSWAEYARCPADEDLSDSPKLGRRDNRPQLGAVEMSLSGAIVRFSLVMAAGVLVLASGLFFVLPRVSAGYLAHLAPRNRILSGFSEQVRLGQIGEIQQSSAVVMHVEVAGGNRLPSEMYWRGLALSLFDGKGWFNPVQRSMATMTYPGKFELGRTRDGWTPAGREELEPSGSARLIRYRVLMEPIGTNLFFFAPYPVWMEGDYRSVHVDAAGAVFNADRQKPVGTYIGVSDISSPDAARLRAAGQEYPATISLRNLQLPPKLNRRIPELTAQITQHASNPYDRAVAIEHYLNSEFGYTLQLPKTQSDDPLAQFLFERKQGHCEYFASAMAVMLRTIGIPSRLVNGFRGAEFNDLTGSYIVRARDAHSWVEAYFPGSGWVRFDPTPASSLSQPGLSRLDLYVDAMREFWREWVVNYDFSHQRTIGASAASQGWEFSQRAERWGRELYVKVLLRGMQAHSALAAEPKQWTATAAVIIVLVVGLMNRRRLRRTLFVRHIEKHSAEAPEFAASLWYERMVRAVGRRGWHKAPSQTSTEFMANVGEASVRDRVAEFNGCYVVARFGKSGEAAARLPRLFEAVRAACKSSGRGESS